MAPKRGKQVARGPKAAHLRAAAGLPSARDLNLSPLFSQGFTMRDEARNTASHQSSWVQGARLRQKPVAFISAGFTEPLKDTKMVDGSDVNMEEAPVSEQGIDAGVSNLGQGATKPHPNDADLFRATPQAEVEPSTSMETPAITADSEDVADVAIQLPAGGRESAPLAALGFFFDLEGDKSLRPAGPAVTVPVRLASPAPSDSSEEVILFKGRVGHFQRGIQHTKSQAKPLNCHSGEFCEQIPAPANPVSRISQPIRPSEPLQSLSFEEEEKEEEDNEEDAILADYIANMAAEAGEDLTSEPDNVFSTLRDLGGDHDAFDFGLEDDGEGNAAKRYPDYEPEDASNSDDNDLAATVDDESLARLLAKQEELGMGTDKLLLCDDSFGTSKLRSRGGQPPSISPADMDSVANDLNGLDLTDDWTQPNFRQPGRSRRSKQPPTFNVSDSELEVALQATWKTDRERKKRRKLERELLRAEGLLGKNVNPDDPRVKYQSHMTLDDIKTEFVLFLITSAETVQFPPMDNNARSIVHDLARRLNIKSKSAGKGDQRRPELFRTKRTMTYSKATTGNAKNHVEMAALKIGRTYFHRPDHRGPRTLGATRSGGGHQAVTYREGEIVGASAPQLGQENKGHAMLEKMGWSQGMALGALENKGILEPVAQVVKRSKAGLG